MIVRSKATLTSKQQLTLPAAVRAALNVTAGDALMFEIGPDGVRVLPAPRPNRFSAFAGRYRIGAGRSQKETNAWLRELRGHESKR
uniref:Putative Transcriptional regulator, AbrB family n=1 Tax=mine drainage metagenome TaxID=410659 RepID=E6Q5Y0_9ZZZZ